MRPTRNSKLRWLHGTLCDVSVTHLQPWNVGPAAWQPPTKYSQTPIEHPPKGGNQFKLTRLPRPGESAADHARKHHDDDKPDQQNDRHDAQSDDKPSSCPLEHHLQD